MLASQPATSWLACIWLHLNVVDPVFVSLLGCKFRLLIDSPVRKAVFNLGTVDFDGEPRIYDGQVDIGAYENNDVLFKGSFETLV